MKRFSLFLLLVSASLLLTAQQTGKLVILHTNDLHSKLRGFAPETKYTPLVTGNDETRGGFSRLSAIISSERNAARENLLVLDAGDYLMGTLFHHFEDRDGFQLLLMKKMGYDVISAGNHEFDAGPAHYARILEAARQRGEIPEIVLSNIEFSENDAGDDRLEKLFSDGAVRRSIVIEKPGAGLKIGIFALMGVDADEVAPAAAPVTFSKQIRTAKYMVRQLKQEGCNMIICLSHSGLGIDKRGNLAGEDYKLASEVKGIDLIISGHTHTTLSEPLIVNGIPIVQTGAYGTNIGKVVFNVEGGSPVFESSQLIAVDDNIKGDSAVETLIEERKEVINNELLNGMGLHYDKIVAESSFNLVCDEYGDLAGSNLGPLVADAIHSYVNSHSAAGSDISIVAAGVIRNPIVAGEQSVPDIFRVMSLGAGKDKVPGYPLSRVYVTGRELKSILEILRVAWKSSTSNYIYYSGIEIRHDPSGGLLRKIVSADIVQPDGSRFPVDFSKKNRKLYSIAANSYILEFVGIIRSMSFGLLNVVPKDANGTPLNDFSRAVINFNGDEGGYTEGKEWLALIEFLSAMPDNDGNGIPDIDEFYRKPPLRVIEVSKK